jgi:L-ascorbate metabolism protein UlaG (beta-lactamase superfamily)
MKRFARALISAALALLALPALAQGAKTQLTFYGQSAFLVTTPKGLHILIDPWLSNPVNPDKESASQLEKVDYILITHGHFDHVGDAIDIAKRTGAKLIANADLGATLAGAGYPADQASPMTLGNMGGPIKLNDEVTVVLVPAVHSSDFRKEPSGPGQAGGTPVGFVVQIAGGPTLYHTGDTDVFGDMSLIHARFKPDLMLACIGGHYTMDPAGAALAATLVQPKQIVPMHYGTFPILDGTPAELRKQLQAHHSKAAVVEMKPGETRSF